MTARHSPHPRRNKLAVLAAICVISAAVLLPAVSGASGSRSLNTVRVIGWGFSYPDAIASNQDDLYVANEFGDTIDVLPLDNGSPPRDASRVTRVWYGAQDRFSYPLALALHGSTLWVLSDKPGAATPGLTGKTSLTALDAASGRVIRVITAVGTSSTGQPATLGLDDGELFVTDPAQNVVLGFNANNGTRVAVIRGPRYGFNDPSALATIGPYLLVSNASGPSGGSVTELDSRTGALVQLVSGKQYKFKRPSALVTEGSRAFVVSSGIPAKQTISAGVPTGSITEIDLSQPSSGTTSTSSTSTPITTTTVTSSVTTSSTTSTMVTGTSTSTSATMPSSSSTSSTSTTSTGLTTTLLGTGTTTPPSTTTTTTPMPARIPTASLVRVIAGPQFHLLAPTAAAISDGMLLVSSETGNEGGVVAIDPITGSFLRVLSGHACNFVVPSVLSVSGNVVFVANFGGGITELRAGACTASVQGSPYELDSPQSMVLSGSHLFVTNNDLGSSQVTELNASSGTLARIVTASDVGFGFAGAVSDNKAIYFVGTLGNVMRINPLGQVTRRYNIGLGPWASVGIEGTTLYVAGPPDTLVALNTATGHIRSIFAQPSPSEFVSFEAQQPIVFHGADFYYLATSTSGATVVREVDRTTGKLVRVFANPSYHIGALTSMALWRNDLVLSDPGFNFSFSRGLAVSINHVPYASLVLIDATTGRFERRLAGKRYDFMLPDNILASNDDLFVSERAADAVTEVDADNGHLIKVMTGSPYDFDDPTGLALYKNQLYVSNAEAQSLTDIKLGTAA